jgi:hypothetical protein
MHWQQMGPKNGCLIQATITQGQTAASSLSVSFQDEVYCHDLAIQMAWVWVVVIDNHQSIEYSHEAMGMQD